MESLAASGAQAVDERLKDPIRSLINVLRDKNSTLTRFGRLEQRELSFYCQMNETCPNRLELRQQMSDAYADQIAKYVNEDSHSEAFELIRSTFHLWAG